MAVLAIAAGIGGLFGPAASAKPITQAAPGNLTANPTSATAGSTVSEVFRFTAKAPVTAAGTTLTINRAPDWSVFQVADKGAPGYVVLQKGTCTATGITVGASTIVVNGVKCSKANQWIQVSYFNAVAPTTAGVSTFTAALSTAPSTLMPANITVTAGPVSYVGWLTYPPSITTDNAMTPSQQVLALDQYGNAASTVVSLALGAATPPTTGVLGGTTSRSTVAGVATFPGLTVDKVGSSYTLLASAGSVTGVASQAFNVFPGAPASMVVSLSPSTVNADGLMTSVAKATVTDAHGNGVPGVGITILPDVTNDVTVSGVTQDLADGTYTETVTASTTAGTNTIIASCSAACGAVTTASGTLTEVNAGDWITPGYGTTARIFSNYGTCCYGTSDPPVDVQTLASGVTTSTTFATPGDGGFADGPAYNGALADPNSSLLGPLGEVTSNAYMWYDSAGTTTTLTFDSTRAGPHVLRMYATDYNDVGRAQFVDVYDDTMTWVGGAVLSSFEHGAWVKVPITVGPAGGVFTIKTTNLVSGVNAVLNGVFVD